MKYFIFNNKNSYSDLGMVIKKMPFNFRAEKNIEKVEINGRNGTLHIDNNTYKSINITIECIVYDMSKIDIIKSVLQGTGNIIFSNNNEKVYTATIKNQIDFNLYLSVLAEFPLQLELQPFARGIDLKTINLNKTGAFNVNGNVETPPILTITGTGNITLNNKTITVNESDIEIDCELMNCTKEYLNKNDKVILDEFPILKLGNNDLIIGSGISNVKIKYYERWY